MNVFQQLLAPRSIAVVGVSDDPNRPGSQAVNALLGNGYAGRIYPVNPKYESFAGLRCYPSVAAIDEPIDVVVVGVPAAGVIPVIEMCAARCVAFAVILSGGFRESGPEGVERERRILEIARAGGVRLIGPNCLGLANIHDGVYAAFGSIVRPPRLQPGGVSLVTQSGGFGYSIVLACHEAGIGFRHVIATGNETDVATLDLVDALIDDPGTEAIVTYIEGMADTRKLLAVGRRALAAGKPLLLWKGGVTEQGARAAESHTASMTGTYAFYQALFKQAGIIEIQEIHETVDFLKGLAAHKLPAGRGVAIMGVSGGSAIVFADAGERQGLQLCTLSPATQERLATVVPAIGAIHNPIDLTAGYFSAGNKEKLAVAVEAALADPQADALCVNLATTGKAGSLAAAEVLGPIAARSAKPLLVFSSAPKSEIEAALSAFAAARIPVLASPARAAQTLAMLARYREARERVAREITSVTATQFPAAAAALADVIAAAGGSATALSEAASKTILAALDVPVTREVVVSGADLSSATALRAPFVVKVVSPDIPHKTEVGGVKVGVANHAALGAAVAEVMDNARRHRPQAQLQGALVAEMVTGGFELIAGVVNDAVFGPVVMVGAGGIHAEVWRDSACRLAPFDALTARAMLDELRCRPILDGVRGAPALDVDGVCRVLATLSQFAWAHRAQLREIDINPLFVLADRVVAADALIVPAAPAAAG